MQRKLLGVIGALAITAAACTPSQFLRYVDAVMTGHEAEAKAAVAIYEAERADATAGRPCAEWYDVALSAGFTADQWREPISRVMHRESMCDPGAVGPTDDWGLMQIHGPWVGSLCGAGIACTRAELLDPETNLRAAMFVYGAQGWGAWTTYR
jgi:soluble lytic murein transglycosylase-like protein